MTPALAWSGLAIFAATGFFFAIAEAALFSLGQWRARQLASADPGRAARVAALLTRPQDLLATLALGGALAHGGLLAIGAWMALSGEWPFWTTLIGLITVILFLMEALPKTLAVRRAAQWSLRIAGPLQFLVAVIGPVRGVGQRLVDAILRLTLRGRPPANRGLSDAEYEELLDMAAQDGTLEKTERDLILEIIRLDTRTAKEAMTPRSQVAAVPDDMPIADMIEEARRRRHRRLLVYDESLDAIVGTLDTRKLLRNPKSELEAVLTPPAFVPETMNLLRLLTRLQNDQHGMAIVLDEFGGTDGIITVEDILEEIVGEIRSEGEKEESEAQRLGRGRWRVKGSMRLDDFRETEFAELGDVPDIETMGGLLTNLLEIVPSPGQSAQFSGLELTALACDERRVLELQVARKKGARR
jgi:putative hemolysin